MSNNTEDFIEVENEATSFSKDQFENDEAMVGDKPSEGFLDTPSDAAITEATSGSSIEDVQSSKLCKICNYFVAMIISNVLHPNTILNVRNLGHI